MNTYRFNNVLYKSVTTILHLFAAIIGIICLSVLPYLFDGLSLDFVGYFTELKTTVYKLLFIKDLTYQETFREWPIKKLIIAKPIRNIM